jgi:hypothetical protein
LSPSRPRIWQAGKPPDNIGRDIISTPGSTVR